MKDCKGVEVTEKMRVAVYEKDRFKYHGTILFVGDDFVTLSEVEGQFKSNDIRVI